jgi:hypothetical protein
MPSFLALGNVRLQALGRKIGAVHAIVALMQRNTMVMDDTTKLDLLVQLSIALGSI